MTSIEQVTGPIAAHGEGPVWWDGWGGLRWVDMLVGDVLALDQKSGKIARQHVGTVAAAIRPRRRGGAVLGLERGFGLLDAGKDGFGDGALPQFLGEVWTDPHIRMNDGGCDPDGRFYCGSMRHDQRLGAGKLYRLDADRNVGVVLESVTTSNGLAWSPDGGTAYYVDSATWRIDAFDYDYESGLRNRRAVVMVPEEMGGHPDGLAVDAEGYLWLALFGGSAVCRYSPHGKLEGTIKLPATQVTACAFGGPRLDQLYITTSQLRIDPATQPLAGAVFRANVGVRGLPIAPYSG